MRFRKHGVRPVLLENSDSSPLQHSSNSIPVQVVRTVQGAESAADQRDRSLDPYPFPFVPGPPACGNRRDGLA